MRRFRFPGWVRAGCQLIVSLLGAVTFYTCIPIPTNWPLEFRRIARWAPLIGLLIGGLLGIVDLAMAQEGMPILTRSALIIACWMAITGGLHLDGVMDTADGLAVQDKERRLAVMSDSATGAFGAMAAIALLLLKTAALTDIETNRSLALMAAAGWGRWGQVMAIALYPYLKPTGKGAFHTEAMRKPSDVLFGLVFLLILCSIPVVFRGIWWVSLEMLIGGSAIAYLTGVWFYRQLGGHTGDTYGAVVEWTEALFLCLFTTL